MGMAVCDCDFYAVYAYISLLYQNKLNFIFCDTAVNIIYVLYVDMTCVLMVKVVSS